MTETVYSNGVVLRRIKVGDMELSTLYDKDGVEFDSCETRDEAKMLDYYRHQWNEPNLPLDHVDVCVEGAENLVHAIVRRKVPHDVVCRAIHPILPISHS